MRVIDKIMFLPTEPPVTDVIWAKPVEDGFAFYLFDGTWKPMKLMDGHGTPSTDDDTPYTPGEGGELGPDTVGTREIINNSVQMEDLNDSVKDKIQKDYYEGDESLHMDFNING
jgi:hypothetical protein